MERTKLSSKGQVVIPHRIRDGLGWKAGVEFVVEPIEGGTGSVEDISGVSQAIAGAGAIVRRA